jgi:hypothetical protein
MRSHRHSLERFFNRFFAPPNRGMSTPLIAPDTGVLLAVGLGPGVDFQAPMALEGLETARSRSAECVLLHTVRSEFQGKLDQMEAIIGIVRSMAREWAGTTIAGGPLAILESVFERVRQKEKYPAFFVAAVETASSKIVRVRPEIKPEALLSEILTGLSDLRALVRIRVDELRLTNLPPSPAKWVPTVSDMRGVHKSDLKHLLEAGAVGAERRRGVVFFEFDGPLFALRSEISRSVPWVRVTNHNYIQIYVDDDASKWGVLAQPPTEIPPSSVQPPLSFPEESAKRSTGPSDKQSTTS